MKTGRKKRSRRDEQSRDARDRQADEIERLRQENERLRRTTREVREADRQSRTPTRTPRAEFHHDVQAAVLGWPRGSPTRQGASREESTQGRRPTGSSRAPS